MGKMIAILCSITIVLAFQVRNIIGVTCYEYNNVYSTTYFMYCSYSCCGTLTSRQCCSSTGTYSYITVTSTTTNVGLIVGSIFGGIAFLLVVIASIWLTCYVIKKDKKIEPDKPPENPTPVPSAPEALPGLPGYSKEVQTTSNIKPKSRSDARVFPHSQQQDPPPPYSEKVTNNATTSAEPSAPDA